MVKALLLLFVLLVPRPVVEIEGSTLPPHESNCSDWSPYDNDIARCSLAI